MHEVSLVQALLSQLADLAREHKCSSISKVRVEIGPFSGVVADSFQFGFDVLAPQEKLTEKARLEIVSTPMGFRCLECGNVCLKQTRMPDSCPACGYSLLTPEGGDGLILLQVEMD